MSRCRVPLVHRLLRVARAVLGLPVAAAERREERVAAVNDQVETQLLRQREAGRRLAMAVSKSDELRATIAHALERIDAAK